MIYLNPGQLRLLRDEYHSRKAAEAAAEAANAARRQPYADDLTAFLTDGQFVGERGVRGS